MWNTAIATISKSKKAILVTVPIKIYNRTFYWYEYVTGHTNIKNTECKKELAVLNPVY